MTDIENPGKLKIKGYKITDDIAVLYDIYKVTPQIYRHIEKAEKAALSGKSTGYDKIARALHKYPRQPFFKDLMIAYYVKREEANNADKMIDRLHREHPEFILGLVGKAMKCYEEMSFERMPEILGENFDLKALAPSRKKFYIDEFTRLQYAAMVYFQSIGETEKAIRRLDFMEEVAPREELTLMAPYILQEMLSADSDFEYTDEDDFDEDDFEDDLDADFPELSNLLENYRGTDVPPQPKTRKKKEPRLNHTEVALLYVYDLSLPAETIDEILSLPRKTLIEDLETLLDDSISRFTYLTDSDQFTEPEFVCHALFLLAELNAKESTPTVYKVLSQSIEYYDVFLERIFRFDAFDPFYKLLAADPEAMVEYIKKPAITTMPRMMMMELLREIVRKNPSQKFRIFGYYNDLIDFFLKSKPEDNVQDNMLMDALIINLTILKADQFLPKIEQLIDGGFTLNFDDTPIEDVAAGIHRDFEPEDGAPSLPLQPMIDTYRYMNIHLEAEWDEAADYENYDPFDDSDVWDDDEFEADEDFDFSDDENIPDWMRSEDEISASGHKRSQTNMTVVKSPKIGRNDPCPCGSGKKYKKCCLGKED